MRPFIKCQVAVLFLSCALIGCGSGIVKVEVKQPKSVGKMSSSVNVFAAASEAVASRHNAEREFVEASIWLDAAEPHSVVAAGVVRKATPAAASTSIWDCIATAETGGDYSMHGSTYSTAFGVINDIVREYGSPEEQAQIFSGTASRETQIAVVSRFSDKHGFGGWGQLTRQKCNL